MCDKESVLAQQKEKQKEYVSSLEPKGKCPICKKELGFMGWCFNCRIKAS
jgi:hypothetical protein